MEASSVGSVARIVVRTGLAEKAGFRILPRNRIGLEEIGRKIMETRSEYVALIPDISYLFADLILSKALENLRNADAVIVIARPMSVLRKLWKIMGNLPILEKITGHPRGYMLLFRRSLVKSPSDDIVGEVMRNACRVIELSYDIPPVYYIIHVYSKLPYPLLLTVREPLRILKYAFVGFLGSLVNLLTVSIVAEQVGAAPGRFLQLVIPGFAGFEVSLLFNFILHEMWTFSDMSMSRRFIDVIRRLVKYHVASIASLAMQVSSILVLTGILGWSITFAALIGIMLGFIGNYLLGRLFTWSPREENDRA